MNIPDSMQAVVLTGHVVWISLCVARIGPRPVPKPAMFAFRELAAAQEAFMAKAHVGNIA